MSEHDTNKISQEKRRLLPDSAGDECPVCGDPFDVGSTGYLFKDRSTECFAWVRVCVGSKPEYMPEVEEDAQFCYVHKDEHLEDRL